MRDLNANDTIVAVSTGWAPAAVGIVRLSGRDAHSIARSLIVGDTEELGSNLRPSIVRARLAIADGICVPADVLFFTGPRSYTGQDVAELHLPGALPLLRATCDTLIARGARRALPGEFTARAYVNGKLDREQVDDVLRLLRSAGDADLRGGRRAARESRVQLRAQAADEIAQALALVEAGIDFVDEEDVRFISPVELCERIDHAVALFAQLGGSATADTDRMGVAHVALVGLPNAGKSTLFNRLVGAERAIVSPVIGTTRDVIAGEIEIDGVSVVLQDCAGLGDSTEELELASYVATERTAAQADVVVWVHAANAVWMERERSAVAAYDAERLIIVESKSDLAGFDRGADIDIEPAARIEASAATGAGIDELRRAILETVVRSRSTDAITHGEEGDRHSATESLRRARVLAAAPGETPGALPTADLIALELRLAYETLDPHGPGAVEAVLSRIFSQFCVGK